MPFLSSAYFFIIYPFRVSNSLDPDQAPHCLGPDLGPDCLPRLSADHTSRQRVTVGVVFGKVNNGCKWCLAL